MPQRAPFRNFNPGQNSGVDPNDPRNRFGSGQAQAGLGNYFSRLDRAGSNPTGNIGGGRAGTYAPTTDSMGQPISLTAQGFSGFGGFSDAFFPGAGMVTSPGGRFGTPSYADMTRSIGRGGGMNFGGMGGFGGFGGGGGRPASVQTVNTLRPEQQDILSTGSGLVNDVMGLGQGANPFLPMNPADTMNFINQYFRPSAQQNFDENVMPQISESFVGPGTYWGGARAEAESRASQDFENQMLQQSGQMFLSDRDRAANLLPFASQLAGLNTGITFAFPEERGLGGMNFGMGGGQGAGVGGGVGGGANYGEGFGDLSLLLDNMGLEQDALNRPDQGSGGGLLQGMFGPQNAAGAVPPQNFGGPFGAFDGQDDQFWSWFNG